MTPKLAQALKQALPKMPDHERVATEKLLAEFDKAQLIESCNSNFMDFVHQVWPTFIHGAHHEKMAEAFERAAA